MYNLTGPMLSLDFPWGEGADCGLVLGFVSEWGRRMSAAKLLSPLEQVQKEGDSSGQQPICRRSLGWVSFLSQRWKGTLQPRGYKVVLNPSLPLPTHTHASTPSGCLLQWTCANTRQKVETLCS